MLIYLAGGQPTWRQELEGKHLLVAYSEPRQLRIVDEAWTGPLPLVDSGAFSIWKGTAGRREGLDVASYSAWLNERQGLFEAAIAFDVIGGSIEENLGNLDVMEAAGLKGLVIPVFHEGDDFALLDAYIARGYGYIGLGGTASRGRHELVDWLIKVLDRNPPSDALRYHGLAMTQQRIIEFLSDALYSVDSSSWLNPCRYGIKGSAHMFKDRSPAFMRQIGIGALLDMPQRGGPPSKDGQLRLFKGA